MPYVFIVIAFIADRLTKWWAVEALAAGPVFVHPWLTLRLTYNSGVAFGFLQGSARIVGWLTVIIVIGLIIYLWRLPQQEWITRLGLGLLIGGALGNLIDRVSVGEVVDFIQLPLRTGIFNFADVAVNAGMIIMLAGTWWHERRQTPDTDTAVPPSLPPE